MPRLPPEDGREAFPSAASEAASALAAELRSWSLALDVEVTTLT